MQGIARFIQIGANTFLRREFLAIAPCVAILALLLFVTMPEGNWQIALGFVVGAGAQLRSPVGNNLVLIRACLLAQSAGLLR